MPESLLRRANEFTPEERRAAEVLLSCPKNVSSCWTSVLCSFCGELKTELWKGR
jgi:hypothetical protein